MCEGRDEEKSGGGISELREKIGDGKGHSGAYSVKLLSMHLVHLVVGSSPW